MTWLFHLDRVLAPFSLGPPMFFQQLLG